MPADPETIRGQVIAKLLEAVEVTEKLAKESSQEAAKEAGGMAPKARWYQLMGYLSQTLNGVLEREDWNETKKDLAQMKRMVVELQNRAAKAKARNRKTPSRTEPVSGT